MGLCPGRARPRKENVHALKQLGYEAHCMPIEEFYDQERFNVISMADVLEHMPFPKVGLAAARRLLRQGGVLFLSMPNMENIVWRLLHANRRQSLLGRDRALPQFLPQAPLRACWRNTGSSPLAYHVSERYRVCMELIAAKRG